jgi:hypothetical protein
MIIIVCWWTLKAPYLFAHQTQIGHLVIFPDAFCTPTIGAWELGAVTPAAVPNNSVPLQTPHRPAIVWKLDKDWIEYE